MNNLDLFKELTNIGPRRGQNETLTLETIKKFLESFKIEYRIQPFSVEIPICTKAELFVDDKPVPCLGSSITSGDIPDGRYLISHFGYTGDDTPYNIAYNPMTDAISVVDHFRVPSVTISRESVVKIIMGNKIKGRVEVEKSIVHTGNILVGNLINPMNIVIAHFDSIVGPGAVDNAGSIVVMFETIINNKPLLENTLFVFAGNEEVVYDDYKLSGYSFRVFEEQYSQLMLNAKQLIVMDGLGMLPANWSQDGLDWVLQVKMLDKIRSKVYWLQSEQTPILKVFHTIEDKPENIRPQYLQSAQELLLKKLIT